MRYIIFGAGAIGAHIGGRLHKAGCEVVLVARGAHGAAMARNGLRLRTTASDEVVTPKVVGAIDEVALRPDDVVLLGVKTQDSVGVLHELALAAPDRGAHDTRPQQVVHAVAQSVAAGPADALLLDQGVLGSQPGLGLLAVRVLQPAVGVSHLVGRLGGRQAFDDVVPLGLGVAHGARLTACLCLGPRWRVVS